MVAWRIWKRIGLAVVGALILAGCAATQSVRQEDMGGLTSASSSGAGEDAGAGAADISGSGSASGSGERAGSDMNGSRDLRAAGPLGRGDNGPHDIHFEFDRYHLTDHAKAILQENAQMLQRSHEMKLLVEGHADERGTNEYNLALGEKRAQAARDYLMALGIEGDRISVISYGEEHPLDPRHNEEAWAKNRRDHFVLMPR